MLAIGSEWVNKTKAIDYGGLQTSFEFRLDQYSETGIIDMTKAILEFRDNTLNDCKCLSFPG
jgi:hypothetical protein